MPTSRFSSLARWCFRHRWQTIAIWVVGIILVNVIAAGVGKKESSDFRLPGTESQSAYDLLAKHSPAQNGTSDQLVFFAKQGTLKDAKSSSAVKSALGAVAKQPGVASVTSPLDQGGQLSKDGRTGVANVLYEFQLDDPDLDAVESVQKTAFKARSASLEVENGGQGAAAYRQGSGGDPTAGIGFLAAAVVLLFTFGTAIAAGLPLVTAILALIGTAGGITLFSHLVTTPDFASQLADLIGIGVGVDYALFVVTRYRAEVAGGSSREDAAITSLDTAGRTVFFAGSTVIIALLGLLLLGLNFLQGVAIGAALAVLLTMIASLTLLPALLGLAGDKIERLRVGNPFKRRRKAGVQGDRPTPVAGAMPGGEGTGWARWSAGVQRRPWPAAILSLVVLLALASPALGLRLGSSDQGVDPSSSTTRKAYDLIADGFGPGTNGTFLGVVDLDGKSKQQGQAAATAITQAVGKDPGIASVTPARVSQDGAIAIFNAAPKTGPQDEDTTDTLERVRDDVVPSAERSQGVDVAFGGTTATTVDFTDAIAGKLPLFVGVVVLLSGLLLLMVFRSVFIPIKAALMNLLSIGAALGFVTLVFQDGVGAGLLGIETGPIESFLPVLLFAIVFGLSMDYEVFLVSRVHEEWEKSGDASGSVVRGLATTGRVITAAASIMIVVFLAFLLAGDDRVIKLFGIGLASAVFFDAVIIRCLLVPALMEIAGRRAWYLPKVLDRVLPNVSIERSESQIAEGARA